MDPFALLADAAIEVQHAEHACAASDGSTSNAPQRQRVDHIPSHRTATAVMLESPSDETMIANVKIDSPPATSVSAGRNSTRTNPTQHRYRPTEEDCRHTSSVNTRRLSLINTICMVPTILFDLLHECEVYPLLAVSRSLRSMVTCEFTRYQSRAHTRALSHRASLTERLSELSHRRQMLSIDERRQLNSLLDHQVKLLEPFSFYNRFDVSLTDPINVDVTHDAHHTEVHMRMYDRAHEIESTIADLVDRGAQCDMTRTSEMEESMIGRIISGYLRLTIHGKNRTHQWYDQVSLLTRAFSHLFVSNPRIWCATRFSCANHFGERILDSLLSRSFIGCSMWSHAHDRERVRLDWQILRLVIRLTSHLVDVMHASEPNTLAPLHTMAISMPHSSPSASTSSHHHHHRTSKEILFEQCCETFKQMNRIETYMQCHDEDQQQAWRMGQWRLTRACLALSPASIGASSSSNLAVIHSPPPAVVDSFATAAPSRCPLSSPLPCGRSDLTYLVSHSPWFGAAFRRCATVEVSTANGERNLFMRLLHPFFADQSGRKRLHQMIDNESMLRLMRTQSIQQAPPASHSSPSSIPSFHSPLEVPFVLFDAWSAIFSSLDSLRVLSAFVFQLIARKERRLIESLTRRIQMSGDRIGGAGVACSLSLLRDAESGYSPIQYLVTRVRGCRDNIFELLLDDEMRAHGGSIERVLSQVDSHGCTLTSLLESKSHHRPLLGIVKDRLAGASHRQMQMPLHVRIE